MADGIFTEAELEEIRDIAENLVDGTTIRLTESEIERIDVYCKNRPNLSNRVDVISHFVGKMRTSDVPIHESRRSGRGPKIPVKYRLLSSAAAAVATFAVRHKVTRSYIVRVALEPIIGGTYSAAID